MMKMSKEETDPVKQLKRLLNLMKVRTNFRKGLKI